MADTALDERIVAAVDLIGRTGATEFQVGYLHDDVPVAEAGWYAHAQYRGARMIVEDKTSPLEAVEALAERLMTGARCRCGALVALSRDGAWAFGSARLVDGTPWSTEHAAAAGQCLWVRDGRRWYGACGAGR